MTRPAKSCLVIEGKQVKLRLQAEKSEGAGVVHVDWLRFTADMRYADEGGVDKLFPLPGYFDGNYWEVKEKERNFALQKLRESEVFDPACQALELAESVARALGEGFEVDTQIGKGYDFYAHRWQITLQDKEVGWVGFGASGDSPNQKRQAQTLHVNLYGAACTYAKSGWRQEIRSLIDRINARITRIDLALDWFDGYEGGIESVRDDYTAGHCDVGGKRPKCSFAGDWCNGNSRSFYIGSKEAGKQTNVYEKGHQLFGPESGDEWLRFELRYGNKLRYIPSEVLTDPDSYFAGASDWHASVLRKQKSLQHPKPIKCEQRLGEETVDAAVSRKLKWFETVAAPTFKVIFRYLPNEKLLQLFMDKKRPASLFGFSERQIESAFKRIYGLPVGEPCPLPA